jgi:hypothetical protein
MLERDGDYPATDELQRELDAIGVLLRHDAAPGKASP